VGALTHPKTQAEGIKLKNFFHCTEREDWGGWTHQRGHSRGTELSGGERKSPRLSEIVTSGFTEVLLEGSKGSTAQRKNISLQETHSMRRGEWQTNAAF